MISRMLFNSGSESEIKASFPIVSIFPAIEASPQSRHISAQNRVIPAIASDLVITETYPDAPSDDISSKTS